MLRLTPIILMTCAFFCGCIEIKVLPMKYAPVNSDPIKKRIDQSCDGGTSLPEETTTTKTSTEE